MILTLDEEAQAQMKQLAGMRGLIAKPSGEIIKHQNFKF